MPFDEQEHAAQLAAHRRTLEQEGGAGLAARPWQREGQPASDADLVRLAAWKAARPDVSPQVVAAGLGLLSSARAELDQAEAGLLFAARAAGMTFQQIGAALGLGSGQAAQQRMARVLARLEQP
ncbi:hypothetical protein [Actinomadura monticuli]|uniref:DNA-binding protein n=1 Tax=Actinomadura monticuli TaxID=3097367 RepID=A0ABV4QFQ3_9ACTN